MNYLNNIVFYVTTLVFALLALQAIYLLLFAVAGKLAKQKVFNAAVKIGKFAIYIPSYKEDSVIIDTAKAAIALNYPADKKKVIVIADSLKPETLAILNAMPIQVVVVIFDKSTKAKALNVALEQTPGEFDYALILDADNVCEPDFLYQMNTVLQSGFMVVQGQRVAKNTNTTFALLDAISEGVNNHIFRRGHRALGLSCAIIGSGMAIDFDLFKKIMPEVTAVGGFDKEMELRLLRKKIRFEYAADAIVYDEKITHQENFENQRRRWLSAQLHYMQRYLGDGFVQLFKGNIDFFDKVIQTLLIPRILMLGITPVLFFISLFPGPSVPYMYWLALALVTYFSIFISIPSQYINKRLFNAAINFPKAFFIMFKLFFKLKGANKTFIHTLHGETANPGKKA